MSNEVKADTPGISFNVNNEPVLEFMESGDILVKGKKIENDMDVIIAFREFLITTDLGLITNKKLLIKSNEKSKQSLRDNKIKSLFDN